MSRIENLLEFLNENPKDSFVRYALALEYVKQGSPEIGLNYFEGLVEDDPEYVGTYYHLAKLYLQLSRKSDAESCYEKGIIIAKKINDQHSLAELQNAFLNLQMGIEED